MKEYIPSNHTKELFQRTEEEISTIGLLRNLEKNGTMNATDAAIVEKMRKDKTFKLKEEAVLRTHVGRDGKPRAIATPCPANKMRYSTKRPDGLHTTANTYEGLIEKLYDYYLEKCQLVLKGQDYSMQAVFEDALESYIATRNPSENTVYKYKHSYKRFFEDCPFAHKDIRQISEYDLQKYTQEMVTRLKPKKKAFFDYMGVLNLTFDYARRQKMIPENPVDFIENRVYLKSCDQTKPKSQDKILSPEEIKGIQDEVRKRIERKPYYVHGYMVLLAIETGMRAGELCSLKWEDLHEDADNTSSSSIHIHTQQLSHRRDGKEVHTLVNWTKNEKGVSQGGRYFPITNKIQHIFDEIRVKQRSMGIHSDFVFANENGAWISASAYEKFLARLCKSQKLEVTNNHAFRMSLNSNVFIPLGIPVTTRALLLGHSVEVNLKNYSYAEKNNLEKVCNLLDSDPGQPLVNPKNPSEEENEKAETLDL